MKRPHDTLARVRSLFLLALLSESVPWHAWTPEVRVPQETDAGSVREKIIRQATWGFDIQVPGFEAEYNPNMKLSPTWSRDWSETNSLPDTVLNGRTLGPCPMGITVMVSRLREGAGASVCRSSNPFWSPESLKKLKGVDVLDLQDQPITSMHVVFHNTPAGKNGTDTTHHFFGYFMRGDHCFILQIRPQECEGYDSAARRVIGSFKLLEDTGATQETAKLAQKKEGGDPRDWRFHMLAGSLYLHQAKPTDPKSARRFYESALQLGGAQLEPSDTWAAEEGIGLSYLMEDQGAPAIPHLVLGLEAAEQMGKSEAVEEALHNLLCGYSLAGQVDAACERLEGPLARVPESNRKEFLKKQVNGDRQLKNLRQSACYRALMEKAAP